MNETAKEWNSFNYTNEAMQIAQNYITKLKQEEDSGVDKFSAILLQSGLIEDAKDKNHSEMYEEAQLKAKQNLENKIAELESGNKSFIEIDQVLSEIVEQAEVNVDLSLGIARYKIKDVKLGSYNANPDGAKSNIIARNAALQEIGGIKLKDDPEEVDSTYIGIAAARIRGALSLIEKTDNTKENKEISKKACLKLMTTFQVNSLSNECIENLEQLLFEELSYLQPRLNGKRLKAKDLKEALNKAKDLAMLNTIDDHCHKLAITKKVGSKNILIMDNIGNADSKEMLSSLELIKKLRDENAPLERYPAWFLSKGDVEQAFIKSNIENHMSDKALVSSQMRGFPSGTNYYQEISMVSNENKIESYFTSTRGQLSDNSKTQHKDSQKDVDMKFKHSKEGEGGKEIVFVNVATNGLYGLIPDEYNIHQRAQEAAKKEGIEYINMPLNYFGRFIPGETRWNKVKALLDKYDNNRHHIHITCKSSKDRTSLFHIMLHCFRMDNSDGDIDQIIDAIVKTYYSEDLAASQGGSAGVYALKLKNTFKSKYLGWLFNPKSGLGYVAKYGKQFSSDVAKLNEYKVDIHSKENKELEKFIENSNNLIDKVIIKEVFNSDKVTKPSTWSYLMYKDAYNEQQLKYDEQQAIITLIRESLEYDYKQDLKAGAIEQIVKANIFKIKAIAEGNCSADDYNQEYKYIEQSALSSQCAQKIYNEHEMFEANVLDGLDNLNDQGVCRGGVAAVAS